MHSARERISRGLRLYCPQPWRTAQHRRATLDFCAYCIKNKRQKLRNFVHILVKLWFFGFRPQYVVDFDPFHPTKSPTSCGFTQFAFGSKWCYTVLAQSKTAPQHQPAVRRVCPPAPLVCTLPSKQRPVKAAHLHSIAHSAADSGWKLQAGTAQRTYHSKYSSQAHSKIVGGVRGPS